MKQLRTYWNWNRIENETNWDKQQKKHRFTARLYNCFLFNKIHQFRLKNYQPNKNRRNIFIIQKFWVWYSSKQKAKKFTYFIFAENEKRVESSSIEIYFWQDTGGTWLKIYICLAFLLFSFIFDSICNRVCRVSKRTENYVR